MKAPFKVIIPVRFASTRLPGKPLAMIGDKTLMQHVYDSALRSGAERVVIATDDDRIEDAARSIGAGVIMTSGEHRSGTDRIREAAEKLGLPDDDIVVNVQGDEYGIDPGLIKRAALALAGNEDVHIATLCTRIRDAGTWTDPNAVKVVRDARGRALYFSRSPLPWGAPAGEGDQALPESWRHIGLYAYRVNFLKVYAALERPLLEQTESLEQLRALYHGYRVQVDEVPGGTGIEINTEEDLQRARRQAAGG